MVGYPILYMQTKQINQAFPRLEKAFQMLDDVVMISTTEAIVKSQNSDKKYKVNCEKRTCECPDHQFRGVECKHIRAVCLGKVQQKMVKEFSESNLADKSLLLEWN